MLRQITKSVLKIAGFDLHPISKTDWKWGYDVHDYYPVRPRPRWGHGTPPHDKLTEALDRGLGDYADLIGMLAEHQKLFASVPKTADAADTSPFWNQRWFHSFDAVALMGIIAAKSPRRYFEIGCGNSTKFTRHTINREGLSTTITSFDPDPRASIDALCDAIVRKPLEDCDIALFDQLERGDVLFFDGSHRAFTNSDVTVFFLELLPRLRPGVIVHIHDIFLPWDYPDEWNRRLYSEQYILAAMLTCPQMPFKVMLPNWYACHHPILSEKAMQITRPLGLESDGASSFWLEML